MKIYPAIDLLEGRCVRLFKGDFQKKSEYEVDPVEQAQRFAQAGAKFLHIVDLDGAKDASKRQKFLIEKIVRGSGLKVQVGGGLRSVADIEEVLSLGADRVIIGSLAVRDPSLTAKILAKFGGAKVVLALDVKLTDQAYVAHDAWDVASALRLEEVVKNYLEFGLSTVLCTDIDRDGTLTSPNFELYKTMKNQYPSIEWIASGGVAGLEDLKTLKRSEIDSVVLGKALYENRLTLEEALDVG